MTFLPRVRDVLAALVATMAIVSLLGIVELARNVREDLDGSRWVAEINHLSNELFREAMFVAMERGLMGLALTLPELPPDLQRALDEARATGDVQRRELQRQIAAVLQDADLPALSLLASDLAERRDDLADIRAAAVRQLAGEQMGITPDIWFETASRFNESLGRMQDGICSARPRDFAFFDVCPAVKRDIFWVGEFATRERGMIAQAIAAGRPFTPAELASLRAYRAIIEHSLERIANGIRGRFPGQVGIGAVVAQVRIEYAGRYAQVLRSVVAAGTLGNSYPVDAVTWYRQATTSIDPLLSLMRTLASAVDESVERFRTESLYAAGWIGVLMLAVFVALLVTVLIVQRRILARLGQLRTAARRISEDDLTRPVAVTGSDELGELGDAFERMRRSLLADRSRREGTEMQLRTANEELARFAYVVSHDLKAPLRAIHNLAGWIAQDVAAHLTPEGHEHLGLLQSRVRRMDHLINALLDYSRVGRREGLPEEVSVRELLDEVVQLRDVPPGFTVLIREPMPHLATDRVQLQQVFANLIGNAIEHHDRTDGRVEVSAEDAGDFWRFSVSDDGPGIPLEQQGRIFEIFQRLDTRNSEGTGIGLAIVKKAVERLGGTVTVESAPGRGATFRFDWPKRLAAVRRSEDDDTADTVRRQTI